MPSPRAFGLIVWDFKIFKATIPPVNGVSLWNYLQIEATTGNWGKPPRDINDSLFICTMRAPNTHYGINTVKKGSSKKKKKRKGSSSLSLTFIEEENFTALALEAQKVSLNAQAQIVRRIL